MSKQPSSCSRTLATAGRTRNFFVRWLEVRGSGCAQTRTVLPLLGYRRPPVRWREQSAVPVWLPCVAECGEVSVRWLDEWTFSGGVDERLAGRVDVQRRCSLSESSEPNPPVGGERGVEKRRTYAARAGRSGRTE